MPQIHAPPDTLRVSADPVMVALRDPQVLEKLLVTARIALSRWMKPTSRAALEQAAEEVASEAQAMALAKSASYDPARAPAEIWVQGIVRKIALRRLDRAIRKKTVALPGDVVDPAPSAEDRLISQADKEQLQTALATLDPFDRRIADLRFGQGMPHTDIAAALGITLVNARVRACRIVKELAAKLSPARQGGQS